MTTFFFVGAPHAWACEESRFEDIINTANRDLLVGKLMKPPNVKGSAELRALVFYRSIRRVKLSSSTEVS